MEYLASLFSCCSKGQPAGQPASVKISCNLNCCRNKTYQINITDHDDVEKVMSLIKELQEKESQKN